MIRVLVACEESQIVTIKMREIGIEAYSCDLKKCTGGYPEWHIRGDVTLLLEQEWDMVIAFPPCTDLASSGSRWFEQKQKNGKQQKSIDFFLKFTRLNCRWAIENPIGIMSKIYRKPDQIIHPWQFGHEEKKATCIWLNKLPLLRHTKIMSNRNQKILKISSKNRTTIRSRTYSGIARAMAKQWGKILLEENSNKIV